MLFSPIAMAERRRSPHKEDDASDNRSKHQQRDGHFRPAQRPGVSAAASKFLRQLRIAELIGVEIHDANPYAMLDFARTKIMQQRSPLSYCSKSSATRLESKMCPASATIHYPLRHVDASAREIRPVRLNPQHR